MCIYIFINICKYIYNICINTCICIYIYVYTHMKDIRVTYESFMSHIQKSHAAHIISHKRIINPSADSNHKYDLVIKSVICET